MSPITPALVAVAMALASACGAATDSVSPPSSSSAPDAGEASGASTTTPDQIDNAPPTVTLFIPTGEWDWTTPNNPDPRYDGQLTVLVPTAGPGSESVNVQLSTFAAGDTDEISITVTRDTELLGVLKARQASPTTPT